MEKDFVMRFAVKQPFLSTERSSLVVLDGEGVIDLGNINSTPFSEIVEGERANNLFDGFSRREAVEEMCRKCGYRKKFGG